MSQKVFNKCDKIMAIENEIISTLKNRETWVFCISDMLSFGNY